MLFMVILSCNAQDKKKEKVKTVSIESKKEGNPEFDIKVNKTYDAKGNLIKFDSTYSYFHSSKGLDSAKISLDTVFNRFKSYYSDNIPNLVAKNFDELFLNDSLFKYDFLNENFFGKRFELNPKKMDDLFFQMDSLKNEFLKKSPSEISEKLKIKK